MKAVVQEEYGSPDVLSLREIDRPEPGEKEVLVRVRAAGLDQGVWHVMAGMPYMVRLMGFGVRAPKTPVRGTEVAGVVEPVGRGVTRFVDAGDVTPAVDRTYPLDEAPAAIRHLRTGDVRGKLVITVAGGSAHHTAST
jgi:NADPH:quinone reductase-like Zn-dependent oxidoreductase